MKIVILTNGSKHGLEIIRQLDINKVDLSCILLEKKLLRKKEIDVLSYKLGKASIIIPLIPFKNLIYRLFRYIKYDDVSLSTLKRYSRFVKKVPNFNGKECEYILQSIEPDLIVLGGSRIIKENILDIPSIGTLNAHPGILPFYRGLDVIEWSLYNNEIPGVTVHFVNSGIDTGKICISERIKIEKQHSIDQIKKNAVNVAAKLMTKTVKEIIQFGKITTTTNDESKGKHFQKMPKKIYQELLKKIENNE
tara:strand:+ start:11701 stop:12450 length:750 start_codon:yes stop_codon:yes gene_type:complete